MKLRLVKQGDFLGTKCDFYVDEGNNVYMSRTQIGYALEYKSPSKGIENVHNRHYERMSKFCILIRGSQIEGGPNTLTLIKKFTCIQKEGYMQFAGIQVSR